MEASPIVSRRIVSLLPAATEIVASLGLVDQLVGRSHECDTPAGVQDLPALTSARIDVQAPSRTIHEQVGRALADAPACTSGDPAAGTGSAQKPGSPGALFSLDIAGLAALSPDLVLTQAACDVCAIAAADVAAAVKQAGGGTRVLALSPATLADVLADVLAVGTATGRNAKAREVVARLQARIDSVSCRAQVIAKARRPRVAMIEWLDPPMAGGNWIPQLVQLAGGEDALGRPGAPSHWIGWDDVAAVDPDVVVLVPCGLSLDRVVAEAGGPAVRPHLERLRAFRDGRAVAVDGHHLFNRPGPRLVDSLELLAQILHPGAFRFPHAVNASVCR